MCIEPGRMIRKWLLLLSLGTVFGLSAPITSYAQSSVGSDGGQTTPGKGGPSGIEKNAAVGSASGSAGSAPETSLSRRSSNEPVTREGDTTNQITTLAPYALALAVFLAVALYFFVFRKPTTPEGDAAADGTNT